MRNLTELARTAPLLGKAVLGTIPPPILARSPRDDAWDVSIFWPDKYNESVPNLCWFQKLPFVRSGSHCLLSLVCLCPAALHAGLIQRVDATVAGSVITNASGVVTSWVDQSGSGNNASSLLGTVSFPSASLSASGKAGLAFGPTNREALQLLNVSATASLLNLQPGVAPTPALPCWWLSSAMP